MIGVQRFFQNRLCVAVGFLFSLTACGPVLKQSVTEVPIQTESAGLTDGVNGEGQKYTGFGPSIDLEDLKSGTEKESTLTEFGSHFKGIERKVSARSVSGARLEVVVTQTDGVSLGFSGEVTCQKDVCAGSLKKEDTQKNQTNQVDADQIEVTCESAECRVLKGVFLKDKRRLGGFILRDEERKLERTHRNTQSGAMEVEELQAHVVSTEILGGRSQVQIQSHLKKNHVVSIVEVPLVETDGECVDLKGTETSTCLMGNSRDGEILLRESNAENDNTYLRVLPRASSNANTTSKSQEDPSECLKNLALTSAHPWIRQVAKECERPEIKSGIQYWSQTSEKKRFENFLALREFTPGAGVGKVMDPEAFHLMLKELKGLGLPEVIAFVSYIESRFQPRLRSGAGAVGWWQLMPGTAIENGLKLKPVDERSDIQRSTVAAGKFLLTISKTPQWNQNLAMTLAAYNMGQYGLLRRVNQVSSAKKGQMAMEELVHFSADFWLLSRLRVLPSETRNYVPRIFSAMKISLSPEQYGVSGPAFTIL